LFGVYSDHLKSRIRNPESKILSGFFAFKMVPLLFAVNVFKPQTAVEDFNVHLLKTNYQSINRLMGSAVILSNPKTNARL